MEHTIAEDGDIRVVAFKGDIDLEFSGDVRNILLDVVASARVVVVDLSAVSLIDSSGVASLLEAFQSARKRGKKFVLAAVEEPVLRVLKLARLDKVFNIVSEVEDARRQAG